MFSNQIELFHYGANEYALKPQDPENVQGRQLSSKSARHLAGGIAFLVAVLGKGEPKKGAPGAPLSSGSAACNAALNGRLWFRRPHALNSVGDDQKHMVRRGKSEVKFRGQSLRDSSTRDFSLTKMGKPLWFELRGPRRVGAWASPRCAAHGQVASSAQFPTWMIPTRPSFGTKTCVSLVFGYTDPSAHCALCVVPRTTWVPGLISQETSRSRLLHSGQMAFATLYCALELPGCLKDHQPPYLVYGLLLSNTR